MLELFAGANSRLQHLEAAAMTAMRQPTQGGIHESAAEKNTKAYKEPKQPFIPNLITASNQGG